VCCSVRGIVRVFAVAQSWQKKGKPFLTYYSQIWLIPLVDDPHFVWVFEKKLLLSKMRAAP
jgi:hypothetical protein